MIEEEMSEEKFVNCKRDESGFLVKIDPNKPAEYTSELFDLTVTDLSYAQSVLDREIQNLAKDFIRDKKVIAIS